MTTSAMTSALTPAALGARIIAYVIDAIALGLVGIVVVGAIYSDFSLAGSVLRAIILAVLGFLYFGYTWTAWRATPGQRMLGLMTVNAADGAALTWNQATTRWAFLFGPSVLGQLLTGASATGTPFTGLIGLLVLAYYVYLLYTTANDPRRQGFHDKQAATLVTVKTGP
jgi:uncharacterized RDD family membrane protein YckC